MDNFQFGAGMGAAYAINANQQAAARDLQYNQIVAAYISQGMNSQQAQYAAQQHFAQIAADTPRSGGSILFNIGAWLSIAIIAFFAYGLVYLWFFV